MSYDYLARNATENGTVESQSFYNITVLLSSNDYFIIEERLENQNDSSWVQRSYDPDTRESLTFPGNYSWHWIDVDVEVNDSVTIGNADFIVTAIHESWEFRGNRYQAIEVGYSEGNLSAQGFYDEDTTLLLYANVTMVGFDFEVFMEYFFDSSEQLQAWPSPLTPPGRAGFDELSKREQSPRPLQAWGFGDEPPWDYGESGIEYQRTIGAAKVAVRSLWNDPEAGNMGSDVVSVAGSPYGRADAKTYGVMWSEGFFAPTGTRYKSWSFFTSDGLVVYYGYGMTFYSFTTIEIKIHYRHELAQVIPMYVVQSGETVLYYRSMAGWWIYQPNGVDSWSNVGSVASTGFYSLNQGYYVMKSWVYSTHKVCASGPAYAFALTWINVDATSMGIYKP